MISRLIFFLFLTIIFYNSHILAQFINCPTGSSLKTDITVFTVSTPLRILEPILGDFYSPSWQSLLLQTPITFSPSSLSRTLHYPSESLNLTETLLCTSPQLQWHLTSSPFILPTLLSSLQPTIVTYYTQTLSLLPVCPNGAYTTITWTIHACISPLPTAENEGEGEGEGEAITWFKLQHRKAAGNIFDTISRGWFGNVSTEQSGNTCSSYDTRVPELAPSSSGGGNGNKQILTPTTTGGLGSVEDGPVPTTTFKTTYPLVPGLVTVSWPAGATGSNVGGSISTDVTRPETVLKEEQTSSGIMAIATYKPENGATGRKIRCGLIGVVTAGWLLL